MGSFCGDGTAGADCGTNFLSSGHASHASRNARYPGIDFRPEA